MRDLSIDSKHGQVPATYKEVVIIGNGPGGLSASYILSGHAPVYNGLGHPDPMLSARLSSFSQSESLLSTEKLKFLSQGMEDLGGTSVIGTLFDSLMHPGALMGMKREPPISWVPTNGIDHVVLGDGPPGGIWQRLDPELLTLSLSSWMELPGLRISSDSQRRATAREVAEYYVRYVQEKGLSRYLQECKVVSVKYLEKSPDDRTRWEIVTLDTNGNKVVYRSRFCILATGSSVPKRLEVDGESERNVVHDLVSLESRLPPNMAEPCRVFIVGAGLSAADAVILARFRNCEVAHSFRTDDVTLGQMLPESLYPEYHKVREMMRSTGGYPGYSALPGTVVKSLANGTAALAPSGQNKTISLEFDVAAVLIGTVADLSFLEDFDSGLDLTLKEKCTELNPKLNPVAVNPWSYETTLARNKGLYAIGSLVGDIYVRYIPGGAIAACAHILNQIEQISMQ